MRARQFNHPAIRMKSMAFSGYPGFISSSDDFYALDTGLVVTETTLNVLDERLYDLSDPNTQVQAWVRNLVANRLATTGKEWIDVRSTALPVPRVPLKDSFRPSSVSTAARTTTSG
jgi:hypothetical protein